MHIIPAGDILVAAKIKPSFLKATNNVGGHSVSSHY